MGAVARLTLPATILALLSVAYTVAVATGSTTYGGTVPAPSGVILHSVCGDSSRELLFAVGTAVGTNGADGVIYRIDNLTAKGYVELVRYKPGWPYLLTYSFYACEVVDSYLFATAVGGNRSTFAVYEITAEKKLNRLNVTHTPPKATVAFRDADVKKVDSTYYIYALSVAGTSVVLYYTSLTGVSFGKISSVTIGNGYGYGASIWGNYLGVLWRDTSNNLVLTVFDVSAGTPSARRDVVVVQDFTGARAAEAAYSGGFLVAANGNLFRVYSYGSAWVLDTEFTISGVFYGDAYAMLVTEEGGAVGAYILTQVNTAINISAVDVVRRSIAYVDSVVDVEQSMEGFGDAYVVWVDPSTGNVVVPGYPGSRPYMVYTTVAGASSSLIYYDLTRGGVLPYPVPEPWFVSLAVLASTATAVALIVRRAG